MSGAWLLAAMVAPLGSEALDLSVLGRLVVVALLLVVAHLVVVALLLVLAHLVVVALLLAHLAVVALLLDLAELADLVVEAAQLLQVQSSRQSFSASTARMSPSPVQLTYVRAPSTR